MLKPIFYRIAQGALILLLISFLLFVLLASTGGDAISALQTNPQTSEQTLETLRRMYGLDRPLPVRYAMWMSQLADGNLGQSIYYQVPVWDIIEPRLWNTIALATAAMSIAVAVAFTLGLAAARQPGSLADRFCDLSILLASSTPRLVLAILALSLLARTSLIDGASSSDWQTVSSAGTWMLHLLPPALILSLPLIALLLAQTRAAVSATLNEDYVQVARAKGVSERLILVRHALRPALNPLITTFGSSLGGLMSGSVVVEQVLNWPGLGQLSVIAVQSRDVALLMGIVLITSAAVLFGNLLADVLLRWNDPRLRTESQIA